MVGLDFKLPPEEQITAAAAGQTRIKWDERIAGHVNDADNKVKELIYDGIVQGQSYSDVAKGIKERFDITATKAETIARTESHRAREMGSMAATIEAAEMGINMMRRWLATLDGRTRDTHGAMDGQERPVFDDKGEFAFFNSPNGGTALYPGGFGIASEDINCRCSTIDIVKGYEPTTRRARDEFGKGEVIPYTNFTQYAQSKGWATPYAGVEPRVVMPSWQPTMTQVEANEWARNSALGDDYYHGTSNAEQIKQQGFNLDVPVKNGRIMGDGVYINDVTGKEYWGSNPLKVKVNVSNPIDFKDVEDGLKLRYKGQKIPAKYLSPEGIANDGWGWVDDIGKAEYPDLIKSEARARVLSDMGYDAVTYYDRSIGAVPGSIQPQAGICIFDPKRVVVIVD